MLLAAIWFVCRFWRCRTSAESPLSALSLIAVLFTSGLDGGLVMLPLIEFPTYQDANQFPTYQHLSPLFLEYVFWGASVWLIYFVSAAYFCFVEPKLQIFDSIGVKVVTSLIVLVTCAFTLSLYLQNLPFYLSNVISADRMPVVTTVIFIVILAGTLVASMHIRFMTWLSRFSCVLFAFAIGYFAMRGEFSWQALAVSGDVLLDYIVNLPDFLLPTTDYHRFYIAWWFSWAILLGQSIARFTQGLTSWQMIGVLVIAPLIPTFVWFAVLYQWYISFSVLDEMSSWILIALGTLFVINSLDFMIANYCSALNLNVARLGVVRYGVMNFSAMSFVTWLFYDEYILIEWLAMLVVLIMVMVGMAMLTRQQHGTYHYDLQIRK